MEKKKGFFFATLAFVLLVLSFCNKKEDKPRQSLKKHKLNIVINEKNKNLVFRYFDFKTKTFKTATSVNDIPEESRSYVTVYDMKLPIGTLAPDEIIVANLNEKDSYGNFSYKIVKTLKLEEKLKKIAGVDSEPQKVSTSKSSSVGDEIIIFGTEGCPHCREAKEYFKSKNIPFKWFDVERDEDGLKLLYYLGKQQGIPEQYLNSVPIIYIKGKLIIGFSRSEIENILNSK